MENKDKIKYLEKLIENVPDIEILLSESPDIIPDKDRPEEYQYRYWNSEDLYFKY